MENLEEFYEKIRKRYGEVDPEALIAVLSPIVIPIKDLDKTIFKAAGQTHWRATFRIDIADEWSQMMQRGMTGKFVSREYVEENGVWREICKGRIIDANFETNVAVGEIYVGKQKTHLIEAINELDENDYLEIDQFGASAKILSSLAEYYLAKHAEDRGYKVRRMPEDTARHLGTYYNYDFEFEKNSVTKKIEAKSIWGTNTDYARLIHSTTSKPSGPAANWTAEQKKTYYPTSSCKFSTQDIFAVNLFLRTGKITDFAFAKSISIADAPNGLPFVAEYPEHVNQNPICKVDNITWFSTIDEVWD
ncbi:MAG: hypothetical protein IPK31_02995 [Chitinophagaceae bacterium]|nr:hypothetical protein [Chitinophagaceae bacterium]